MALIELTIPSRAKDLGGFTVGRLLPFAQRRMVGPFVFLDHMGPAEFQAGHGMDVRPHPHIGLSTLTYLFSGEMMHRDTLGSDQAITPGAVNWMTAGSGIAHSERTGADERARPHRINGLQSWIALPRECEETAPSFDHHAAGSLPELQLPGVKLRVIAGEAYGERAPVNIFSPLFYVEAHMQAGSQLELPADYADRALYLVQGDISVGGVGGARVAPLSMPVFTAGSTVRIEAHATSHVILLGGEPLPEQRFIWWNFVSSSQDRIEQAKQDWQQGRFGLVPGDSEEFIPLPAS